jgi:hypothetical protein
MRTLTKLKLLAALISGTVAFTALEYLHAKESYAHAYSIGFAAGDSDSADRAFKAYVDIAKRMQPIKIKTVKTKATRHSVTDTNIFSLVDKE